MADKRLRAGGWIHAFLAGSKEQEAAESTERATMPTARRFRPLVWLVGIVQASLRDAGTCGGLGPGLERPVYKQSAAPRREPIWLRGLLRPSRSNSSKQDGCRNARDWHSAMSDRDGCLVRLLPDAIPLPHLCSRVCCDASIVLSKHRSALTSRAGADRVVEHSAVWLPNGAPPGRAGRRRMTVQ
jgi:hypothetical protein